MCGVVGIQTLDTEPVGDILFANAAKGRDAYGIFENTFFIRRPNTDFSEAASSSFVRAKVNGAMLANFRAEPTTEWVGKQRTSDIQPYQVGNWIIVHNGTISNDKDLLTKYQLKEPTRVDSWVIAGVLDAIYNKRLEKFIEDNIEQPNAQQVAVMIDETFEQMVHEIEGSFALMVINTWAPQITYYATNYRPLYKTKLKSGYALTSVKMEEYSSLVQPYSFGSFTANRFEIWGSLYNEKENKKGKALVVLSGGLDSTVALTMLMHEGYECEAVHFDYGCRATENEVKAVADICDYFGIHLNLLPIDIFKTIGNSRLLDKNAEIADTIDGAQMAHEWVPARNMILTSIVIGLAEARGFDYIALGINLEEAGGGYTDNVQDLYEHLNDIMHWIVGAGKKLEILSPVGALMKREIVAKGLEIDAPMHLTWSCYNASAEHKHCGKCGPCFMRKTAFEMNGAVDPVFVAEGV